MQQNKAQLSLYKKVLESLESQIRRWNERMEFVCVCVCGKV